MQVIVMLVFLVAWLLVFWLGSIALEATGMERAKSRFQALSAISNSGFTTREAESIVNHPKRRRVVAWLIFLGNAGIMSFLILLVLYVRAGLKTPTMFHIGAMIIVLIALGLVIGLGIVDRFSNAIVRLVRKGKPASNLTIEEIIYQVDDYGLARLEITEKNRAAGLTLEDTGYVDHGFAILAIERGGKVLPFPKAGEKVVVGDCLLCYGELAEMTSLSS
jgi:hypothetical protein